MRREQLEHVIAAAAEVSGEREIVVIGSQAILGNVEKPPASMLFSMEADLYPRNAPDKADEIEGSLGEGSFFQSTFGYYAQGVGPETVVGPTGWEERLVRIDIPARVGHERHWRRTSSGSTSYSDALTISRNPQLIGPTYGRCSRASLSESAAVVSRDLIPPSRGSDPQRHGGDCQ